MHSLITTLDRTKQKSGVVLLFKPRLTKEQPEPCFFCGDTLHLQTFKGKIICSACWQNIPALFVCG